MKFSVTVLPQARDDIDRHGDRWAGHHSVERSLRSSDAVYDQRETLRDFPDKHPLVSENNECPYEIREKLVGLRSRPGYRAAFTIKDQEVFILTL